MWIFKPRIYEKEKYIKKVLRKPKHLVVKTYKLWPDNYFMNNKCKFSFSLPILLTVYVR